MNQTLKRTYRPITGHDVNDYWFKIWTFSTRFFKFLFFLWDKKEFFFKESFVYFVVQILFSFTLLANRSFIEFLYFFFLFFDFNIIYNMYFLFILYIGMYGVCYYMCVLYIFSFKKLLARERSYIYYWDTAVTTTTNDERWWWTELQIKDDAKRRPGNDYNDDD